MKNLIIVESPAKAKTIEKFLGKDFKVLSSYGHIRDLKKKNFSIDIDNHFTPIYEVPADKKELVSHLKEESAKADVVWLASDEDREGEAIAWHLYEVLGLTPEKTHRIVFHEITKPAILEAIQTPRHIDIDRVNAQQARRVLDRIVGFELSPVLWRKIKPALSAGRVQSVAVRLICEREKEISAFDSKNYYRVTASMQTPGSPVPLKCELGTRLESERQARDFLTDCLKAKFEVENVTVRPLDRAPAAPFTTSTLQQEAARRLGFSVSQTMRVAQQLYESGHITYMRTDSLNLSKLALRDIADLVTGKYGDQYVKVRHYHTKSKGAQEAHEAIRPTYIAHETIEGSSQERRLYTLIRNRTIASQMADAKLEKTTVDIVMDNRPEKFVAHGEVVKFAGFMKVYDHDHTDAESQILPSLREGEILKAESVVASEKFTSAPARYNEGSLVKKMEELGIGRPSTYAPTISTIQTRGYVEKGVDEGVKRTYKVLTATPTGVSESEGTEMAGGDKGRLKPTDTGMIVNDFLTEYFPDILDYNFTAKIEEKFDDIAEGSLSWNDEMAQFYAGFHPGIEQMNAMRLEHKVGERNLGNDPKTGKPVFVKIGRFGPMVQVGETSDDDKPQFASLANGQSIATITLEEALKLFELPRNVGEWEGKMIVASTGRFGPYLRHDGKFISLKAPLTPLEVTLEQAIDTIQQKRADDAAKLIKDFPEMPGLLILNGRFGPYVAYKPEGVKKVANYKIPKSTDPASLTLEQVKDLMEKQDSQPKTGSKRAVKKK